MRFFYLTCVYTSVLLSQESKLYFERMSLDQGISYNTVFAMHQDSRGMLWFGTLTGLIRFDGFRSTLYRHDPNNPFSLSHDDVISITEDSKKKMWIGTYDRGLNRLDPFTGECVRYVYDRKDSTSISSNIVWSVLENEEDIWVGTEGGGLNRLLTSGKFERIKNSPSKIRKIYRDKRGQIWLGCEDDGLMKFDPENRIFTRVPMIRSDGRVAKLYSVFSILEDHQGKFLIGMNRGLFQLEGDTLRRVVIPGQESYAVINSVTEDFENNLWLGTAQEGLIQVNRDRTVSVVHKNSSSDPRSLASDAVVGVMEDSSGVLWVGTYYGGLQKALRNSRFEWIQSGQKTGGITLDYVNAMMMDAQDNLWIGHNGGLDRVEKNGNLTQFKETIFDINSMSVMAVNSIYQARDKHIFVGFISRGLIELDSNGNKIRTFLDEKNRSGFLPITEVSEGEKDRLWIGTLGRGVVLLDRTTNKIDELRSPESEYGLSNAVLSIVRDSQGRMWVGSYGGLRVYTIAGKMMKEYYHDMNDPKSLAGNYVFSIFEDSRGQIWIGTNSGLSLLLPDGSFRNYREPEGLSSQVICGIEEDSEKNLWISTQKGLSRYDVKAEKFNRYNMGDGLPTNMFNFRSAVKNSEGKIYFGTIRGAVGFQPKDFKDRMYQPKMIISDIKVFNEKVPWENDQIYLAYDQNFFTIEFSAVDNVAPGKNQFMHRLEPIEKAWRNSEDVHEASYTNIAPGDYEFHLRGTNSDGVWSSKEMVFKIFIAPPFWKTSWFLGIVVAFILAAIWIFHKMISKKQIRYALEMERIRSAERERMREEISKDFHDELGHKLTKISLFSELSRRAKDVRQSSEFLNKVSEAAQSLSANTRDFIWALDPEKDTLYDLVIRLHDFARDVFDKTGMTFFVEGMDQKLEAVFLTMTWRRHLTLIFKEAMHNALKHSEAKEIRLRVSLSENQLELSLSDSGKGLSPAIGSDHHGLKNMDERAKIIGGQLDIVSEPYTGTSVRFSGILPAVRRSVAKEPGSNWIATLKSLFV